MPGYPNENSNPQRLQQVLDAHNVTGAEWLILAAIERSYTGTESALFNWVAETAADYFGTTFSDEESRAALDACLRYGWLRIVDQYAFDEIEEQLRDDTAALLVPGEAHRRLGEIDFTPQGATLYRMLAADWLGPDWEDGILVSHDYFQEVHFYSECEDVLNSAARREGIREDAVRARRVIPIGPWCVSWWERFPAGFRMELEIGEA